MIILNETIKVDHNVHSLWRSWMDDHYLPTMMESGIFLEYRFCELLGLDQEDGLTYAIQYTAANMAQLHRYQINLAPQLSSEMTKLFGQQALAFRTIMRVLDEGVNQEK